MLNTIPPIFPFSDVSVLFHVGLSYTINSKAIYIEILGGKRGIGFINPHAANILKKTIQKTI
jgi:hypothetical protein